MLEKEFQYYKDNQQMLFSKYGNKIIVIVGNDVVGYFDSYEDAYLSSISKYDEGTFLIQYCGADETAYTDIYHSRVYFE